MRNTATRLLLTALLATTLPGLAWATDVDGPGDCGRLIHYDYGDAPEGFPAYTIGTIGCFPTCLAAGPVGTQTSLCALPTSTAPGATGFVRHDFPTTNGYWLGCGISPLDDGIDSETDGKTNLGGGGGPSFCAPIPTDCVQSAFGAAMTFRQDECYGDSDAGLAAPALTFTTCTSATVTFTAFNCGPPRNARLNILVDWNHDGDWNDNDKCSALGLCWYEWAVKNAVVFLPTGCSTITSPAFLPGHTPGEAWLRISISDNLAPDDFPWNGSASLAAIGQSMRFGETEDYPVMVHASTAFAPCVDPYLDFGDAPEDILAYPGGPVGHFPTCTFPGSPGTQELACLPPLSTPPGPTGVVIHTGAAGDATRYWLGCSLPPPGGLDPEGNGKVNLSALVGDPSSCDPGVFSDCVEPAFGGMTFGQDECYGDGVDAGVTAPVAFTVCTMGSVSFNTFNCGVAVDAYLNVCVDWNEDGDWNDNFDCPTLATCAYEWAVKNVPIILPPGCAGHTSPTFLAGPNDGNGWLRISITSEPVPDDYPWNGSLGTVDGRFHHGETEDYPVRIDPQPDPCAIQYRDFGDAPEGILAYPSGVTGCFPTCIAAMPLGSLEAPCAPALGTPPGPTGYVTHVADPTDPIHVWLGCGTPPPLGSVDSEFDGKVNLSALPGDPSACNGMLPTDCVESVFGAMTFGQDECYGDVVDAGVGAPVSFAACSLGTVGLRVANCSTADVVVFFNALVDWTQDGDWNDNLECLPTGSCVPEWALKNEPVTLVPGCNGVVLPSFPVGLRLGPSWMRITVTLAPVPDDYPWNGSVGTPLGVFRGGETEDYPVEIVTSSIVGVDDRDTPGELRLAIRPNPSQDGTTVHFALPRGGPVRLGVYDVAGRKLRDLAGGTMPAGEHAIEWNYRTDDGGTAPVGLYLVRLEALGEAITRTVIRVR